MSGRTMNQMTIKDAADKLGMTASDLLMDLVGAGSRDVELTFADFKVRVTWNPSNYRISHFEIVSY